MILKIFISQFSATFPYNLQLISFMSIVQVLQIKYWTDFRNKELVLNIFLK